ncbi:MAG: SDR family NAD(P)-dependent oxidoreductase [Nitrospinae bacterium]|nr:SDR family NAD(P)-dependent oxidoreductase [Nitrospinota bacterium]
MNQQHRAADSWRGKRALITGVCGTVGKELLMQLSTLGLDEIIGIDNNESEIFFLTETFRGNPSVRLYLGDIRDPEKLMRKMDGIDVVLHSAALKHVILCEQSPRDAIQTNILGVQNVIDAAQKNRVGRVLFTSSDKAVNPTNVMGTSKLMGERLMTAAHSLSRKGGPLFASTRFGNVLGSRGSVIPLFRKQIEAGKPVTLTHPEMTRFIMTLGEAVRLVIDSVFLARGGEVFVTKMPVVKIRDLAEVMVETLAPNGNVPIEIIGPKAGEKLYEELMNDEETRRTIELDRYFSVLPAFKSVYENIDYTYPEPHGAPGVTNAYNSSNEAAMTKAALKDYLIANRLLETGE